MMFAAVTIMCSSTASHDRLTNKDLRGVGPSGCASAPEISHGSFARTTARVSGRRIRRVEAPAPTTPHCNGLGGASPTSRGGRSRRGLRESARWDGRSRRRPRGCGRRHPLCAASGRVEEQLGRSMRTRPHFGSRGSTCQHDHGDWDGATTRSTQANGLHQSLQGTPRPSATAEQYTPRCASTLDRFLTWPRPHAAVRRRGNSRRNRQCFEVQG